MVHPVLVGPLTEHRVFEREVWAGVLAGLTTVGVFNDRLAHLISLTPFLHEPHNQPDLIMTEPSRYMRNVLNMDSVPHLSQFILYHSLRANESMKSRTKQ